MKGILLTGCMVVAMSFTNSTYADFTFHSSTQNACEFIAGQWSGSGKASNWFLGDCLYNGFGSISNLDDTGHFTVEISAEKNSGSLLCPNHADKQLRGECVNGVVTIMTEFGNVVGNFSQNSGDAKGTLTVSPGIHVDVTMQFQRAG